LNHPAANSALRHPWPAQAPAVAIHHRILVDNPAKLYGF
jgi:hypothetical protein